MLIKNQICTFLFIAFLFSAVGCHTKPEPAEKEEAVSRLPLTQGNASSRPVVFELPVREEEVNLPPRLTQQQVENGRLIYVNQCKACHHLTHETWVGPGWKNITRRRTPGWLMSMMLYTPLMLANDPEAKHQLEVYKVVMPDQRLSPDMARDLLAFMLKNDEP